MNLDKIIYDEEYVNFLNDYSNSIELEEIDIYKEAGVFINDLSSE